MVKLELEEDEVKFILYVLSTYNRILQFNADSGWKKMVDNICKVQAEINNQWTKQL